MIKDFRIIPVSCMPRTGSTALMNILAQNPKIESTPSNDISTFCAIAREWWQTSKNFQAQGLWTSIEPKMIQGLRGFIAEFFHEAVENNKVIFDKDRGWLYRIRLLEQILGKQIKIICIVRDPREVAASFEKLYREDPMAYPASASPEEEQLSRTLAGRLAMLFEPNKGIIGSWITGFREVINSDLSDKLMIVPYKYYIEKPEKILKAIHQIAGLEPFEYDLFNIEQKIQEEDQPYGWKNLHIVKPEIERGITNYSEYLSESAIKNITDSYQDIIQIAN